MDDQTDYLNMISNAILLAKAEGFTNTASVLEKLRQAQLDEIKTESALTIANNCRLDTLKRG